MVLHSPGCGRVGRRRTSFQKEPSLRGWLFLFPRKLPGRQRSAPGAVAARRPRTAAGPGELAQQRDVPVPAAPTRVTCRLRPRTLPQQADSGGAPAHSDDAGRAQRFRTARDLALRRLGSRCCLPRLEGSIYCPLDRRRAAGPSDASARVGGIAHRRDGDSRLCPHANRQPRVVISACSASTGRAAPTQRLSRSRHPGRGQPAGAAVRGPDAPAEWALDVVTRASRAASAAHSANLRLCGSAGGSASLVRGTVAAPPRAAPSWILGAPGELRRREGSSRLCDAGHRQPGVVFSTGRRVAR